VIISVLRQINCCFNYFLHLFFFLLDLCFDQNNRSRQLMELTLCFAVLVFLYPILLAVRVRKTYIAIAFNDFLWLTNPVPQPPSCSHCETVSFLGPVHSDSPPSFWMNQSQISLTHIDISAQNRPNVCNFSSSSCSYLFLIAWYVGSHICLHLDLLSLLSCTTSPFVSTILEFSFGNFKRSSINGILDANYWIWPLLVLDNAPQMLCLSSWLVTRFLLASTIRL